METRRDNLKGVQKGSMKCSMWSNRHGWVGERAYNKTLLYLWQGQEKSMQMLELSIKQLWLKSTQRKSYLPHRHSTAEQPIPGLTSRCCSRAWGTAQECCADRQHPELTGATWPHRHIQNQNASSDSGALIRTWDMPEPYRCCRFVVPALLDTTDRATAMASSLPQPCTCTSSPALPHSPPPPRGIHDRAAPF